LIEGEEMKREWEIEELIEHFTLSAEESHLLRGKVDYNQLGLAVMLKCFQSGGKFFKSKREIPRTVLEFVAQQLAVEVHIFRQYEWNGRTSKNDRATIREHCGFRGAQSKDRMTLINELIKHAMMPHEHSENYWVTRAYESLRELRIEPFSPDKMERLARSALSTYQESVCQEIDVQLSESTKEKLRALLTPDPTTRPESENPWSRLAKLKEDPDGVDLKNVLEAGEKLRELGAIGLPSLLFEQIDSKWVEVYRQRAVAEYPSDLRRHADAVLHTLLAAFCHKRRGEITDQLVDLLNQIIHKISTRAERKIDQQNLKDIQRIYGKSEMLFKMAKASLAKPEGSVSEVIFSVVSEEKLKQVVQEREDPPLTYRQEVGQVMRRSYGRHYRRMLAVILETLHFRSNNVEHQPVLRALKVIEKYLNHQNMSFYPLDEDIPLEGVIRPGWMEVVIVKRKRGKDRISRLDYELCVLGMLREKLRSTEIWVEGAVSHGNPDKALLSDFQQKREAYYSLLNHALNAETFNDQLKARLKEALTRFNDTILNNPYVKIMSRGKGWVRLSPLPAQAKPPFLSALKAEVTRLWPMTSLLDVLKEADLRVHFTREFKTLATRQVLGESVLHKRLLLCLFGLGTNIGMKQASTGDKEQTADDLLYVKRYFISRETLRNANTKLVNATLAVRLPHVWGEGSVACASDSSKFAVRGENLKSEWHIRYRGRGVMVYWHVERKSLAIYSQLKAPSSSEVASMIEGILRHETTMNIERNYVDTHGQSEIAFAFSHLLGFELLPRLKNLGRQKLSRPDAETYANLEPVLAKPIDWDLIQRHYDMFIQYAAALLLGTTDTETILKRFTHTEVQHETYRALAELGKVIKTIFLCNYLSSEALRREIDEGLNIIENWNSTNDYLAYGRTGELSGRRLADQELSMLALQLLQNALIYINTLMLQQVLTKPYWYKHMTTADLRALTPLIYAHINPYGIFKLDLEQRIAIETAV